MTPIATAPPSATGAGSRRVWVTCRPYPSDVAGSTRQDVGGRAYPGGMCASYGLDPRFTDTELLAAADEAVLDGLRAWAEENAGETRASDRQEPAQPEPDRRAARERSVARTRVVGLPRRRRALEVPFHQHPLRAAAGAAGRRESTSDRPGDRAGTR